MFQACSSSLVYHMPGTSSAGLRNVLRIRTDGGAAVNMSHASRLAPPFPVVPLPNQPLPNVPYVFHATPTRVWRTHHPPTGDTSFHAVCASWHRTHLEGQVIKFIRSMLIIAVLVHTSASRAREHVGARHSCRWTIVIDEIIAVCGQSSCRGRTSSSLKKDGRFRYRCGSALVAGSLQTGLNRSGIKITRAVTSAPLLESHHPFRYRAP